MRATYIYGAGDIRVEDAPDPRILRPTDAIVRVTRACICGSDLHPYHSMPASDQGATIGHEFIGVIEETGADVATLKVGDFVIAPFAWSDGTCPFCREGLQTSCEHGGFWNMPRLQVGGAQAEAVRVPLADGTLVKVPGPVSPDLYPSLLSLSDVYGTGWHAAVRAGITDGSTVTVIGDGAVGLLAVLSASQLGAEQIILMGRHQSRTDLGRKFGATDVVAERGEEGIERVRELTGGYGTRAVLEAVGHMPAYEQALGVVRPGGVISRVGVPQYESAPVGFGSLFGKNVTLTGGPAPVRAYIEHLLPAVLDGTVNPGEVFDRTVDLEHTPDGYRAMDERSALKVMVTP
ncbi:zinc-dependent alcohol dehydrogenase family protein [Lacisediminihabitans profunda]|uniref:Zinc-dependent alcohol dehydrogenase family protein n=1 Tax=Lacisediminihabitans profunda TaxID=2594790 RepID=A0A5C8ULW3_9MICO|nr:zinc-dependent alcohol dehydrogenase family protein [Lacisediminihabitans profunda]TXN28342.1 zinc-dependent alcohol dehydrogenase family protein [Lacisediminihabitans profunda]